MRRILVVEDHPVNSALFCEWMRGAGYEVDAVDTGAKAIARLTEREYHLILMDIALPGANGLVMSRMIREAHETRHIPIVCVSAYLRGQDTQSGCCDAYLQKPVDRQTLCLQVSALIEGGGLET